MCCSREEVISPQRNNARKEPNLYIFFQPGVPKRGKLCSSKAIEWRNLLCYSGRQQPTSGSRKVYCKSTAHVGLRQDHFQVHLLSMDVYKPHLSTNSWHCNNELELSRRVEFKLKVAKFLPVSRSQGTSRVALWKRTYHRKNPFTSLT